MREGLYGNGTLCLMIIIGAWIASALPLGFRELYLAAAILCPFLALLCILSVSCRSGRSTGSPALAALAFLLAGAFACINARLLTGDSGRLMLADRAITAMSGLSGRLSELIGECFSEDTASLVNALLCGRKGGLDKSVTEAFRQSGASHLLALSGLHLGIIYGLLSILLAPLGNSRAGSGVRGALICAICALYVLATGASASLVRAFLFVCYNELRRFFSTRNCPSSKVFASVLTIHLLFSPNSIGETGFQLSYLAVLGALTIYPALLKLYPVTKKGHDPLRSIWSAASMSIACQITTAGLVLRRFGTLPGHFLLTNIISLPLTSILVCASLAAVTLSSAGCCPTFVIKLCEHLSDALTFCMETIAGM